MFCSIFQFAMNLTHSSFQSFQNFRVAHHRSDLGPWILVSGVSKPLSLREGLCFLRLVLSSSSLRLVLLVRHSPPSSICQDFSAEFSHSSSLCRVFSTKLSPPSSLSHALSAEFSQSNSLPKALSVKLFPLSSLSRALSAEFSQSSSLRRALSAKLSPPSSLRRAL